MKTINLLILVLVLLTPWQVGHSQENAIGAYESQFDENRAFLIVTKEFYSIAIFKANDHNFIGTEGGSWRDLGNGEVEVVREFNTLDTGSVGVAERISVSFAATGMKIEDQDWSRVDDGSPGALVGAWLITGRKRDGEMRRRTPGERKTMKILSGSRFQWIAYHTGTKAFSGTGGGTYTTKDGKYIEKIDFFSRDVSRVGAELPFDFELKDGEWHHSGLSSKGSPIYEIWTLRPL